MAYSVYDSTSSKFLEISLTSWDQYQPSLNFAIRQKGAAPNKADVTGFMQIGNVYSLLMNISDPNNTSIVQSATANGNNYSIGRLNNEFIITNNNGSSKVSLNDNQWRDTYNYLNLMYNNASLIKEIITGVRMTMINLFRQVGIDKPMNNNGRVTWTATSWWDKDVDKKITNNNQPNNINNNFQNNNNMNMNVGIPQNNMPSMPSMPPVSQDTTNVSQNMGMPNMGSMPPMPPAGSLTGGIQDMLNSAFNQK